MESKGVKRQKADGPPVHKPCLFFVNTPDPLPFRLLDLPRELRDRIYEFMLAGKVTFALRAWQIQPNARSFRSIKHGPGGSGVNILRTCRQVYSEAKLVLYSHCDFIFAHETASNNSIKLALSFLKEVVPKDARTKIRNLRFGFQERILQNGQTTLGGDNEAIEQLCDLLVNEFQIQHLGLGVWNPARTSKEMKEAIDRGIKPYREIPVWVQSLLAIKELDRLSLHWGYSNFRCIGRTVDSATLMRTTMLQNGNKMEETDGMILRLRHCKNSIRRDKERYLSFEMDIDKNGKSQLGHTRRVKVIPDSECRTCGHYPSKLMGKCVCGRGIDIEVVYGATRPKAKMSEEVDSDHGREGHEEGRDSKPWVQKPLVRKVRVQLLSSTAKCV